MYNLIPLYRIVVTKIPLRMTDTVSPAWSIVQSPDITSCSIPSLSFFTKYPSDSSYNSSEMQANENLVIVAALATDDNERSSVAAQITVNAFRMVTSGSAFRMN